MTPEFKQHWIDALRGGGYRQTKGVLRDCNGFCCLGVGLDLIDPNAWCPAEAGLGWRLVAPTVLPTAPLGLDYRDAQRLASLNDSGESFEHIANWIEAHVEAEAACPA